MAKANTTNEIQDICMMGENEVINNVLQNVQCLNAAVYKKFSKKDGKILSKYVEFCPHPESLNGINAPTNKKLVRLGFFDVNTFLANTIEAMENATSKGYNMVDFEKMVEETVIQGTEEIRKEMVTMKRDIVKKAREYADIVQAPTSKAMEVQLSLLIKQLAASMQCIDSVAERSEAFAIDGNMDLSN